jgi:hypothetical protein
MWVLCDRDPARNWSDQRITLLGECGASDASVSGARSLRGG